MKKKPGIGTRTKNKSKRAMPLLTCHPPNPVTLEKEPSKKRTTYEKRNKNNSFPVFFSNMTALISFTTAKLIKGIFDHCTLKPVFNQKI